MTSSSDVLDLNDELGIFENPKIVMTVVLLKLKKRNKDTNFLEQATIDLNTLARSTINSHYKKKRFAACIIRCPEGAGLFFSSGKIVITFSSMSYREYLEGLYMSIVNKIDPYLEIVESQIQNTTLVCKVKSKIYLNRLRVSGVSEDIKFQAELFPGLNRRITVLGNEKVKVIVFGSGNFNICGCKSKEQMIKAYEFASGWVIDFIKKKKRQRMLDDDDDNSLIKKIKS